MKHTNQVDLPLVFFSLAFFVVLFGLFIKTSFWPKPYSPIHTQSTALVPAPTGAHGLLQIDYNNPIICNYQSKDSSISAQIDTAGIAATVISGKVTEKYSIQGDCLYTWLPPSMNGKKKCGIGTYISIGRQLLSSGIGSIDSLTGTLESLKSASNIDVKAVLKSCKNVKAIGKEAFSIPKGMRFD